ncbi:MAG: ATP-binding cassette domain-containing protein [Alphaproteobacteria bacterium]|nr:ATP-binding cassette domain-containing protein [Alphaproteobacteria bacterium]
MLGQFFKKSYYTKFFSKIICYFRKIRWQETLTSLRVKGANSASVVFAFIWAFIQENYDHFVHWVKDRFPMFYRFKTPNYIQFEVAECGSTALAIILGYYKKFISAEEARLKCAVSRNGSNALNIIKAARGYGLIAQGAEVHDIKELSNEQFPLIAFWDFNHFVVIEALGERYVYINDPAQGPRAIDYETFNKSFTGVVILFEPGPYFEAGGDDPHKLPDLRPIIKKYSSGLILVAMLTFAALIPGVVTTTASKVFVDDIMIKQLNDWLRPLLVIIAGIGVVSLMVGLLQEVFFLRVNVRISAWLVTRFMWHVLNLPLTFFASRHSGDILLRVKNVYGLSQLISGGLSAAVMSSIVAVFYFILMLFLSVKLTLIVLGMLLIGFLIMWFHKQYLATYNQQVLQSMNVLTGIEIGGLRSMEALRAVGAEYEFLNKRSSSLARVMKDRQKLFGFGMSLNYSTQVASTLISLFMISVASLMIMNGHLTLGTLVAFQTIAAGFVAPLSTLVGLVGKIQEAKMHLIRLRDALNHPLGTQTTIPVQDKAISIKGAIDVKDVAFGYNPTEELIIEGINLHVPAGSHYGIVGKSGSGKSTLALLIAGLYPPVRGEIYVDNTSLWKLDQHHRKQAIGFVDADLGIFEGTLQDNITLFQPNISPEEIAAAVKNSCLDDVVESLNGLQGMITESGGNLSGGQRQRIELARVLIQGAKIIVLDEATSALDPMLEDQIYKNLLSLGCTLIVISHRISSISQCDKIIVMQAGRIVEQGTHQHLLKKSHLYKQLVSRE